MLNNGHILTAAEMQEAEQTLVDGGTSIEELMRRAGQGAAQYIWRVSVDVPTVVLCGPGNNGGDGYVIAQWLLEKGADVSVAASGEPKTDAAKQAKSLWQGETIPIGKAKPASQLVDCLFGTGLTRGVEGDLLKDYRRLCDGSKRRIAVDLPSGVHSDSGELLNDIPDFDLTIALGAYKPSHYLQPARAIMGNLVGVDIGVNAGSKFSLLQKPEISPPSADDHKYSRGLVAVIGGTMPGASCLSAMAAQHSGAGYVKLFTPYRMTPPNPSIVTSYFANIGELQQQLADDRITILVIGPGLGRDENASELLECALEVDKPLLLDADALWLLGESFAERVENRNGDVIATPHQGEFERISGSSSANKVDQLRELAEQSRCTVLLKGSDTVIGGSDGETAIAMTSNSWLSTAGTGDVLAGVIAARYAVLNDSSKAASQGQWLHTRAAQLAGPAFTPETLINQIPNALQECL